MLFSTLSQASLLSFLAFQTFALPFKSQRYAERLEAQKRALYSVVEVDGSAPTTSLTSTTPTIETVTQTLKDTKTITASPVIPSVIEQTITKVITQQSLALPTKKTTSTLSYHIVDSAEPTTLPVVHSMKTTTIVPTSSVGSLHNSTPATLVMSTSWIGPIRNYTRTTLSVPTSSIASVQNSAPTTTIAPMSSTTMSLAASQSCFSSLIAPAVGSAPTSIQSQHTSNTTTSISALQPTTTRTTYDDGFWHTLYPYPIVTSSPTSDPYDKSVVTELPAPTIKVNAPRQSAQLGSVLVA